jgi:hypothetical protein
VQATERPDILSPGDLQKHLDWKRDRLISANDSPWLTLKRALQDIEDLMVGAEAELAANLKEHQKMLQDWLAKF